MAEEELLKGQPVWTLPALGNIFLQCAGLARLAGQCQIQRNSGALGRVFGVRACSSPCPRGGSRGYVRGRIALPICPFPGSVPWLLRPPSISQSFDRSSADERSLFLGEPKYHMGQIKSFCESYPAHRPYVLAWHLNPASIQRCSYTFSYWKSMKERGISPTSRATSFHGKAGQLHWDHNCPLNLFLNKI